MPQENGSKESEVRSMRMGPGQHGSDMTRPCCADWVDSRRGCALTLPLGSSSRINEYEASK